MPLGRAISACVYVSAVREPFCTRIEPVSRVGFAEVAAYKGVSEKGYFRGRCETNRRGLVEPQGTTLTTSAVQRGRGSGSVPLAYGGLPKGGISATWHTTLAGSGRGCGWRSWARGSRSRRASGVGQASERSGSSASAKRNACCMRQLGTPSPGIANWLSAKRTTHFDTISIQALEAETRLKRAEGLEKTPRGKKRPRGVYWQAKAPRHVRATPFQSRGLAA